ncbi:MAG: hypothetical protein HY210_06830 [Candidatus Omnitrophica bacterium]|nr:hypothetical protein [Candidatus Omnitrophota bacterium]
MKRYILISFLIGGLTSPVLAWKIDTHQLISINATKLSNNYQRFLSEFTIARNDADGLLFYGSVAEDNNGRFVYHFYDPLNEKGLAGFDPAPVWGYRHTTPFFNEFSWVEARDALYAGLTSETLEAREKSYAKVFRSLGQIIHLVEDMAQPSHVRNDPHSSHYESQAGAFLLNPSHLEEWAQSNSGYVTTFANTASGPRSVVSFDDPFETLALYSNENFFSDDTIFKNYALPAKDETNYTDSFLQTGILGQPAQVLAEDGHIYEVPYITKTSGGYKLAQVGYFGQSLVQLNEFRDLAFQIDDEVARENAQILIPQAVAYSAGLLDYFFRGNLDVEADGAKGIKITNNSGEDMNGTFALYYDDANGTRQQASGASWVFSLAAGATSDQKSFTPPDHATEAGKYILVFKGQMGSEISAVVGAMVDLSKANYLFMIPQTVELPSLTEESPQYDSPSDCQASQGYFVKSTRGENRIWDTEKQRISGRFLVYGSAYIQRITSASLGFSPKVYLNGALIDPLTWAGDPNNQPQTWAIESVLYDPHGNPPIFTVALSDGQVFAAPLIVFGNNADEWNSVTDFCAKDKPDYYTRDILGTFSIIDETLPYGTRFKFVSLAGYPFDGQQYNSGSGGEEGVSIYWTGAELYFYEFVGHAIYYLSDPGFFPSMSFGAEAKYIPPPYEAVRLTQLGLSDSDFSVIFK